MSADQPAAPAPPRPRPVEFDGALADRGEREARRGGLRIAAAGLAACDVHRATNEAVALDGDELIVDGVRHRLDPAGRVLVVGAGKASMGIAVALERILGDRLAGGAIAVRGSELHPLERIDALSADHPLPSGASSDAARRLLTIAESATDRDLVIACFTGGSSALASLPPAGISADEKRDLHELLLSSGIGIVEVNTVRKHVSAIKGGRLAEAAAPARLINLTVSDVAGDHIDAITDPSVPDSSRAATRSRSSTATASGRARRGRSASTCAARTPSRRTSTPTRSRPSSWSRARPRATRWRSRRPRWASTRSWSRRASRARRARSASCWPTSPTTAPPTRPRSRPGQSCSAAEGESTVTLVRDAAFGEGGPNQEAAIAAALELDGSPVAAIFLDTDGSDGGTEHAGAIVDGLTVERAAGLGLDLRSALLEHRSHAALAALDDALVTGPTGTNVNDLFAIVIKEDQ